MFGFFFGPITSDALGQLRIISVVVDGDRVVLSDGSRIQLLGVDAPEKHSSAKLTREALLTGRSEQAVLRQGEISAAYVTALALGSRVVVEYETNRRVYTRPGGAYLPAYVYIADERGNIEYCLNERLLGEGYAFLDQTSLFSKRPEYEQLVIAAQRDRLGLWAEGGPVVPAKSRASEGMDPITACRDEKACIWVSQEGSSTTVGTWQSKPGQRCSCALQP